MIPTSVQDAPLPEKADIISAQEFNLWCAMNSKPFALVQHIWPDGAVEWDVELFPGQSDSTVAYGTGQRDEYRAVIAAFAFLAGVEWAEVVFRSEVERDEGDEDEDLTGAVNAHLHSHAQAENAAAGYAQPAPVEAPAVHPASIPASLSAPVEEEAAPAFPMPTYRIDPDAGSGSALEAENALRAAAPSSRDEAFDEDEDEEEEEDGIDAGSFLAENLHTPVAAPQAEGLRPSAEYLLPSTGLLQPPPPKPEEDHDESLLAQNARNLETVLKNFGVRGEIMEVRPGPVVTLYELEPAPGTKSSRVTNLADDIARSMSAITARIAVVPGRSVIGIELPNPKREKVFLREMLTSDAYMRSEAKLPLVLGKDIGGGPVVVDLARMPHLLIAGTTGSGKSVGINAMILSLLYRLPPDKCRFIMVDPKMLELSVYDDIPHLLTPVVTDPKKAVVAMKWAVREMETRYRAMSNLGVRNIEGYNLRIEEIIRQGEKITRRVQIGFDKTTREPVYEDQEVEPKTLPYIVVVVDEMADLMLVAGKEIEAAIQRLAQMARAAGIHLIMATQRPSVDVITGTIKANFPTRISFQVTSKIDSRTILGEAGAEQLLGQGDMLYMAGGGRITRVHGPFVADDEVEEVVRFIKVQGEPNYIHSITEDDSDLSNDEPEPSEPASAGGSGDDLYDQAVQLVLRERKVSVSFIQRYLQIGYNRSARLVERMEAEGIVSPANHAGKREILGGRFGGPDGGGY